MGRDRASIPITVIGGYLGAGKTTLLNSMVRRAGARRLGIVVNDFGDLAVDAGLVRSSSPDAQVVNLANGCVCCTLGDDLRTTLEALSTIEPALDQIVIEASGVADPAAAAAWGTVPGFDPGGIVVVAAADSVRRSASDRYVGGEVRRQLAGADLVIVTKAELCEPDAVEDAIEWIGTQTSAPTVRASHGEIALDLVLGSPFCPVDDNAGRVAATAHETDTGLYARWSCTTGTVDAGGFDDILSARPAGILRMKGVVDLVDGGGTVSPHLVQVVGRTVTVTDVIAPPSGRGLEAIGIAGVLDVVTLQAWADDHLRP